MKTAITLLSALALTLAPCWAQPFIPDPNTFGLWHFDESPGTLVAFDASSQGFNMSLTNGAQFSGSGGYYSGCVDLTDPDARVASLWTVGNGWTSLTIDAYIYATQINDDEHPIVCRTDFWNIDEVSYYFHVRENGSIAGGVWLNEVGTQSAEAISGSNVIQTGQWYRVAMTWTSGQPVRIFVNNMTTPLVIGAESPVGYIRNSDDPLMMGCNWYQIYGWFYWQGYLDEVRISNVDRYPMVSYPGEFVVDDHTAALWHFNENSGTIAHDATAQHYDMVLQDGAGWHAPGWNNTPSSVDLTDPDGKVNSNYTVGNGWNAITLEAWINPTQIGPPTGWFDGHPIITRQEFHNVSDCSYYLYLTALGEIYAGVNLNEPGGPYAQAITVAGLIQVNNWYHVAVTWSSGDHLRIFVNDMNTPVAVSPQVETGAIRTGTDALRIGCNWTIEYYNDWEYFHGYIDEARISDVNRYPVQPGGVLFEPDEFTAALWHFNEAPGTFTAFDASGHNYNMSLQDGAQFTLAGLYAGGADITDPDAKINSNYLIGNGWEELTIDAHVKLTSFNPAENPVVERYQFYASNPAYYLTILPNGAIYAGVYQTNGGYTSLTTDPVINLNIWYYIQMTWSSGGQLKMFVNGSPVESVPSEVGAIRNSTHPLTIGWFHDTGYGDFHLNGYIDEVRISNIDRSGPPPPPSVQIALTPVNPPIIIPENGGSFSYNALIQNQSGASQIFDVWCTVQVPGGSQFTVLGPVNLTLNAGASLTRLRTQGVPASAPGGEYAYWGFVGDYPWNVTDSDQFPFVKQGGDAGSISEDGWICGGELFPGEASAAEQQPKEFALHGAFPNPFNPITAISYQLSADSHVDLKVYDISGRLVTTLVDGWREAGMHEVIFDGSDLPTGIYLVRLRAGDFAAVQKMALLK